VPVLKRGTKPGCDFRVFSQRLMQGLLLLLIQAGAAGAAELLPVDLEISSAGYQVFAEDPGDIQFILRRENPAVNSVRRQVMAFRADGLKQSALVLTPPGESPATGWPVLLFYHGFHPDPKNYGRIADGSSSRPGDYYRAITQTFAERGYVVVVPDYRGHNDSEGVAFTRYALADSWYTRDAIAVYFALPSLESINLRQVYMLGHSMGGPITQRTALALGGRIRAASIWSSSGPGGLTRKLLAQLEQTGGIDDSDVEKPGLNQLRSELRQLDSAATNGSRYILNELHRLQVPLAIHHARHDAGTRAMDSIDLAAELYLAEKPYQLFIYDGTEHLFSGEEFRQAVERDIRWFERYR
jgi:dipeptidyl aminopeptidase/acylaminoacyl peptidase